MIKYIAVAVAFILIISGIGVGAHKIGSDAKNAEWQQKWDAAQIAALQKQQQQQIKIDKVTQNAEKEIKRVQADAIDANNAADRLREIVTNLRQRLNSETSRASKAEASAADLLAELLVQSDKMAGEFAKFADESRVRGLACERAYDALSANN